MCVCVCVCIYIYSMYVCVAVTYQSLLHTFYLFIYFFAQVSNILIFPRESVKSF